MGGGKRRQFYKRGWSHTKRRGHETNVNCGFCGRMVPKYKTFAVVRGFGITDPALRKDLTAVIALLGLPCGQVVRARPLADKGHMASCKDGSRYRVFVNAEGRVVAQKQ